MKLKVPRDFFLKGIKGAIYPLICLLVLVVTGEVLGRIYLGFRYGALGKRYGIFQSDPQLRMVHRPNSFNTITRLNNYGLRNPDDTQKEKASGALRVMVFGGSTTFGINLKDHETYPLQLQEKLRAQPGFEKTEVLNAGVICYSAGHNLLLMKRLLPELKPDYVLIFEGVNELLNSWILGRDGVKLDELKTFGAIGKSYSQADWLMQKSVLAKLVSSLLVKEMEKKRAEKVAHEIHENSPEAVAGPAHPWVIENYKYLLTEMIHLARSHGATVVVIRFASYRRPDMRQFSDWALEIATREGALVFDEQAHFEKSGISPEKLFIYTGVHTTPLGADLMASGLFDLIMNQEKIKNG